MTMSNKNKKIVGVKGVRIQILSLVTTIIGIVLLLYLGSNVYKVVGNYKNLVKEFNMYLESVDYVEDLQEGSDDMTEQSRLFAVSKDPEHMLNYCKIVDDNIRENAKKNSEDYFKKMGYIQSVAQLDKALEESNALMDYELHSMKLLVLSLALDEKMIPDQVKSYHLPEEENEWSNDKKQEYAIELVFGEDYRKDKAQIDADIESAVNVITGKQEDRISDGINHMWRVIAYLIISCVLFVGLLFIVFTMIVILVIRPLNSFVKCIREDKKLSIVGAYEFKYLALTYNSIYEINEENKARMNFELEHDTLTNAYSRLAFEEKKKQLSKVSYPIALLVIDVDHFKNVNDKYGHDAGDQALKKVVAAIQQLVREKDFVARIGGDEFVIILRNVYAYSAVVIGEKIDRINKILQNPEDETPKLSLSVGIAFSENGYSEELFKKADDALYQTKTTGRCGYSVYRDEK